MITADLHMQLEQRLRQMRRDVMTRIRTRLEGSEDQAAVSLLAYMDQNDDMPTADMLGDDALRLVSHEDSEMHEINVAMGRLENGGAGICIVCGREIPAERLLAMPTVDKCIDCQALAERLDHTGPGPSM